MLKYSNSLVDLYFQLDYIYNYRCSDDDNLLQADWWSFLLFPSCSFNICLLLCCGENLYWSILQFFTQKLMYWNFGYYDIHIYIRFWINKKWISYSNQNQVAVITMYLGKTFRFVLLIIIAFTRPFWDV